MRLAPASGSLWSLLSLSVLWWKSEQMAVRFTAKSTTAQTNPVAAFELSSCGRGSQRRMACARVKTLLPAST
jgi:hypothetical protein